MLPVFWAPGKTTLLNRLLRDPALASAVVLINEFGEIGLDHLFVEKIDGDMIMMASGCLCCTIRGDLVNALEDLLRRRDNGRMRDFDRVIIETTGLADPAPVLHTIMSHPYLLLRFRLEGVVTVVDAINGMVTLDGSPEAVKQMAVADRLASTKTDLIADGRAATGLGKASCNVVEPQSDRACWDKPMISTCRHLLDAGLYNPATKSPDVARWLNAERLIEDSAASANDGSAMDHGHEPMRRIVTATHKENINRHGAIEAFVS